MKIRISADSTCDLTPEIADSLGIYLAPLCFIIDDKTYYENINIKPEDIFNIMEAGSGVVKTAALNIVEYGDIFKRLLGDCDAVIHIDISSKVSSCNQNARLAAEELENVYVVDSENLSTGFGLVVMEAARMANRGDMTPQEICEKLESFTVKHVETSFVLNTLKYMHKGGRCSGVAALGANLLQLKPSIEVKDGVMGVGKKYRGSLESSLKAYIKDRLEGRNDIDTGMLFVTHTGCSDALVNSVLGEIEKYQSFGKIHVTRAGCSVSIHSGPQTLGILYKTL